jgi:hypothetical protein
MENEQTACHIRPYHITENSLTGAHKEYTDFNEGYKATQLVYQRPILQFNHHLSNQH